MSRVLNLDLVVRDYMRLHAIKIWEWDENIPDELIDKLMACVTSECSKESIIDAVLSFQRDVKERLQGVNSPSQCQPQNNEANENVMQLSVKLACSSNVKMDGEIAKRIVINIDKLLTGLDLIRTILSQIDISEHNLNKYLVKLIFKGHIIQHTDRLSNLQLTKNSLVLAFISQTENDAVVKMDNLRSGTSSVRDAAEVLSSRNKGSTSMQEYKLEILDQNGKPIQMGKSERKSLTVAMTLVEQGKKMMGKGQFSDALFTFLEADEDFRQCASSLLEMVDNYALLQLDIVWCYLRLESVDQLPDALTRLQMSEEKLEKTFGPNLMRVELIKGKCSQEKALFVRLHLLKGVVFFYLKRYKDSRNSLTEALNLVNKLAVDELKLSDMMLLGFEEKECRLALRNSDNQVSVAVDYALGERERGAKVKKELREERDRKVLQEKLGVTLAGNPVSVPQYRALISMKFGKVASKLALKRFDNNINECLRVLEENDYKALLYPESLCQHYARVDETQLGLLKSLCEENTSSMKLAIALFICQNGVTEAKERMDTEDITARMVENVWSGLPAEGTEDEEEIKNSKRIRSEEYEAQMKLEEIVSNEQGDDYLDLDFKTELPYIEQYLALLQTV